MERMNYPELVQTVLARYTESHLPKGTEIQLIFDNQKNHYLVIHLGWEGEKRTYGSVIHVDIKDGKIWIQRDFIEEGVGASHFFAKRKKINESRKKSQHFKNTFVKVSRSSQQRLVHRQNFELPTPEQTVEEF